MFGGHFKGGLTGKFKKLQLSAKSRGRKISENIELKKLRKKSGN